MTDVLMMEWLMWKWYNGIEYIYIHLISEKDSFHISLCISVCS